MNFVTTNVYHRNLKAFLDGKRLIVNQGGTSSSKTYSVIQLLISIAIFSEKPLLISIVSESFPHIRRGAMRDFTNIMVPNFDDARWNKSESVYDFGKNVKIEFFSADQASKLRGGRRDILFINEANNITKEAFDELDVRTRICSFIDFNPVSEFWAHEIEHESYVEWIHSTFIDAAQVLEKSVVDNILSRKDRDPNWWRVYGLGLVGKLEGLIHPDFTQCEDLPIRFDREIYGLDFGYSIDPTCLVKNRIDGETVYSKELIYERGMTNDMIAKRMDVVGVRRGYDIIIADSAEPKSIDEIKAYGFDIRSCVKGPDSVRSGLQKVNQYRQVWTKDSLNCIKEQRNYQWERDKDGKFTNKPIDDWDHGMSARRYAVASVPAPKILPKADDTILSKFAIDFKDISEFSTLMCSIWVAKDFKTSITLALWNARELRYAVFGEIELDHPRPDVVLVEIAKYLREITNDDVKNLKKFEIWGSANMHSPETKGSLNDMAEAYSRYNLWVRNNEFWDEAGAILLTSRLIQRKGLIIHERCDRLAIECAGWTTGEGKPDEGFGLARSLCNGVSACWETSRYDPPKKPLKPFSKESQARRKLLDDLIHSNPDAFDNMSDEEIEGLSVDPKTHGAHWL